MRFKLMLAIVYALLVPAVSASAQEVDASPKCGTFVQFLKVEDRHYADHGETGASAGDVRVSRHALYDADGEDARKVGTVYVHATVMPPEDDGISRMFAFIQVVYPSGTISAQSIVTHVDVSNTELGPHEENVRPVTGGTGIFAHATGEITLVPDMAGWNKWVTAVTCHD